MSTISGRQRRAELAAPRQFGRRDLFRRQDRLRRLGVGADDDRISHGFQPPARRDPGHLADRILPVAAGADHQGVGTTLDAPQDGIVGAVEKGLHLTRDRRQVLRADEQVAVRLKKVVRPGLCRLKDLNPRLTPVTGGGLGGMGHLARTAGARVIDDQQRLHGGSIGDIALVRQAGEPPPSKLTQLGR